MPLIKIIALSNIESLEEFLHFLNMGMATVHPYFLHTLSGVWSCVFTDELEHEESPAEELKIGAQILWCMGELGLFYS